jgi:hypothetical protein
VYQQRFGNRTPEEVEQWYKLHSPLWYNNTVLVYQNKTLVLFDLGFLLFNKVESTWWAFVWVLIPHVFILFRYIFFPGPFSIRWTLLYRGLNLWGCLYLVRAVMLIVTPLPNPDPTCQPLISFPDNVWLEAAANLPLVFWKREVTCQDVLFSGHTSFGTTGTLIAVHYLHNAPWLKSQFFPDAVVDLIAALYMLWGWYVIVASHFHYTVDVLAGAAVSFVVQSFYHNMQKLVWIGRRSNSRTCLLCAIWGPMMKWCSMYDKDLEYWKRSDIRLRHSNKVWAAQVSHASA